MSTRGIATVFPAAIAMRTSARVSHSLRYGSVSSTQRAAANEGSAASRATIAAAAAARVASGSASRAASSSRRSASFAARSAGPCGAAAPSCGIRHVTMVTDGDPISPADAPHGHGPFAAPIIAGPVARNEP